MSQMLFTLTAGTHVGCVRTNNEDNFVVNADLSQTKWFLPSDASKAIELGSKGCALVVADGMGGANCGEVASAIAVKEVEDIFNEADLEYIRQSDVKIEAFLCSTIITADAKIKARAKEDPTSHGMGTTIVLAWVVDGNVHLVWCGDSRAYVYNKRCGLTQISHDHSYVQQLVDSGVLAPEDAFGHPQSNIITRCLGDFPSPAQPEYRLYTLQPHDTVMLCTDGLCAYCTDQQTEDVMRQHDGDVTATRNALLQTALDAGGFDNVTVAVMRAEFPGVSEEKEKAELSTASENEEAMECEDTQEAAVEIPETTDTEQDAEKKTSIWTSLKQKFGRKQKDNNID